MADLSLLSSITVVNRSLDHGLDKSHTGHNASNRDELVDKVSLETTGCDVIAPKVSFEVDIIPLGLSRESLIVGTCGLLLRISTFARIVKHLLDGTIEFTLEHADSVDGIPLHVLGKVRIRTSHIIDRNTESLVLLAEHGFDVFSEASLAHVFSDSLLENFFLKGVLANHLVISSA